MKRTLKWILYSAAASLLLLSCAKKKDPPLWLLGLLNSGTATTPPALSTTSDCAYSTKRSGGPVTDRLLITEIKLCYGWIELYNGTSEDVDLSSYQLKVYFSYNGKTGDYEYDTLYDLPSATVHAGQFLVIRSDVYDSKYDYRDMISLNSGTGVSPSFYYTPGHYIELLKEGATVDYVNINATVPAPATASEWSGGAITPVTCNTLRRDADFTDTNTAADWTAGTESSPHLPNTASCSVDTDLDGLPDCAETEGILYRGYSYRDWGARVGQLDFFIEMDYMDQSDPACISCPDRGLAPMKETLDNMKAVFAKHGWTVHYDVGDLFDRDGITGNNPDLYDLCNNGVIPYHPAVDFIGTSSGGVTSIYEIKRDHFIGERSQNFHYLLFADFCEADNTCPWWGMATIGGSTAVLWQKFSGYSDASSVYYQNETVMHELGHNLGLQHGGFESRNYKPNYLGIMNYLYRHIPVADSYAGTDYYSFGKYALGISSCGDLFSWYGYPYLSDNPDMRDRIDYSAGTAADLDENNLDDSVGFGTPYPSIDFDCDSSLSSGYALDVNNDGELTLLQDNDDWGMAAIFSAGDPTTAYDAAASSPAGEIAPKTRGHHPHPAIRNRPHLAQGHSRGADGRVVPLPPGVGQYPLMEEALSEELKEVAD